jgi:indolepyruvate ferredoxin oxidoreductase
MNMTYKLLYNDAVAMTGGQAVPGGVSVAQLTQLLRTEGVSRIIVTTEDVSRYKRFRLPSNTTVWHRDRLDEAQEILAGTPGVTVLIHDQQCAAEKRKLRKRDRLPMPTQRVAINDRVCEGCGDCGTKSNCLSLQPLNTEFGEKTTIHQSSCNFDESCLLGDCPSFVTVEAKPGRRRTNKERRPKEPILDLPEPSFEPNGGYALRLVGIGGTGVVTVSQVLGTAAMLEGRHVTGLDQTGLSQKGGMVISDLHVASKEPPPSAKLSSMRAHTYIAFDPLAAASSASLSVASPGRTIAIVSTERTDTGRMIADRSIAYPDLDDLKSTIDAASRARDNIYLDPRPISEGLLGNHQLSNVVVLGAAYQAGAVPIKSSSIERAIELNGVAVEANLAAFRWGRAMVASRESTEVQLRRHLPRSRSAPEGSQALSGLEQEDMPHELRQLMQVRASDLVAYQNKGYAQRYVAFVMTVLRAERELIRPNSFELAEGVARYLYKLMAYKDEYEVARLHLETAWRHSHVELGRGRVQFHLHPPVLRALGMKRKIRIGMWARPIFGGLVAMRRLRGTFFDPFGHTKMRSLERELIEEYIGVIEEVVADLSKETYGRACAIAKLPDMIRGYEDVKLRSVAAYRAELGRLQAATST